MFLFFLLGLFCVCVNFKWNKNPCLESGPPFPHIFLISFEGIFSPRTLTSKHSIAAVHPICNIGNFAIWRPCFKKNPINFIVRKKKTQIAAGSTQIMTYFPSNGHDMWSPSRISPWTLFVQPDATLGWNSSDCQCWLPWLVFIYLCQCHTVTGRTIAM